jgi:hypothetical protein
MVQSWLLPRDSRLDTFDSPNFYYVALLFALLHVRLLDSALEIASVCYLVISLKLVETGITSRRRKLQYNLMSLGKEILILLEYHDRVMWSLPFSRYYQCHGEAY